MGSSVVMCVLSILLSVLTDFAVTLYKGCSRAANLGQLAPDSSLPHSLSPCSQAGCYSLFFFQMTLQIPSSALVFCGTLKVFS